MKCKRELDRKKYMSVYLCIELLWTDIPAGERQWKGQDIIDEEERRQLRLRRDNVKFVIDSALEYWIIVRMVMIR